MSTVGRVLLRASSSLLCLISERAHHLAENLIFQREQILAPAGEDLMQEVPALVARVSSKVMAIAMLVAGTARHRALKEQLDAQGMSDLLSDPRCFHRSASRRSGCDVNIL